MLLPTPVASPSGNTPENHLRKKPGRTQVTDLAVLVENDLLATGGRLLPTRSRDWKGGTESRAGGDHDLPSALLPTPAASDGNGGKARKEVGGVRPSGAKRAVGLTDVPKLLPTPEAKLSNSGPDYARAGREGSGGDDLITTVTRAENDVSWGKYAAAIDRAAAAVGRPAPPPTQSNRNGNPRLNPAFAEWMMMLPAGHVTDVGLSRNDELKAIGNGVCPPQAYHALTILHSISVGVVA